MAPMPVQAQATLRICHCVIFHTKQTTVMRVYLRTYEVWHRDLLRLRRLRVTYGCRLVIYLEAVVSIGVLSDYLENLQVVDALSQCRSWHLEM